MNQPEPEKYASEIILLQDNKTDSVIIEVNKPYHIKGYSLYQLSYDESYGKWSETSVIEAVKDPWLPVVYIGIFMMLAGSLYLFWKGNEIRKE
jgi:cytochrome c biogenesis protein ResB